MLRTILVADDSPTIRKIVELTFAESEFRVEAVSGGREALERLAQLQPDLVLADVVMPEPSGYEICRTVKGSDRPVPVILLAGTFEPFDPALARECGAEAHLIKPFESATLRAKVRELLEPPVPSVEAPDLEVEEALEQIGEPAGGAEPAVETPIEAEAPERGEEQGATNDESPSAALVEAVARAVVQRLSRDVVRDVAWEVVPKLATEIIRERIRELEQEGAGDD